jgi:hypothetical protein
LYDYRAYDSLAVEVARGQLAITSDDSSLVAGHWSIQAVGTPDDIGPQIGEGELVGAWWDGRLLVQLNPGVADNNVSLSGRYGYEGQRYEGTWQYLTFSGVRNEGSFTAHRTEN